MNNKNILNLFTLVILGLLSSFPLRATTTAILIDNSGSMNGFYNGGQYLSLVQSIRDRIAPYSDTILVFQFNQNGPEPIQNISDSMASSRDTLIDEALEEVISQYFPDIVLILTDNYQDAPGIDQGDIDSFYSRLQGEDVKGIYFFPIAIQFNGNLILYCDELGNPSNTPRSEYYSGNKGIVVYSILINEALKREYENLVSDVASQLRSFSTNTQRLLAKPLTEDTVELQVTDTPSGADQANLEFNDAEKKFYGRGFKEGKPIKAFFYARFKSKFDYLRIIDADLEGRQEGSFKTIGFHKPLVQSTIIPARLSNPLEPSSTSVGIYSVRINIEKVKIKKDIPSLLRASIKDKGYVEGRMKLVLRVRRDVGFECSKEILDKFNTDDICNPREENQSKIYRICLLIPRMAPEIVEVNAYYWVKLEVQYPKWPLFLLITILVLIGLFIFGLITLLSSIGGVKYEVTVDEGEPIIFGLFLFMAKVIKIEEYNALKLQKGFSKKVGAKALSNYSFEEGVKTKILEKEDTFSLSDEEGESHFIRFSTLSHKKDKRGDEIEEHNFTTENEEDINF